MLVGGPHERRLLKHLFTEQEHNKFERPAQNDSETVSVDIKFTLLQIIDFVSEIKIRLCLILSFFKYEQNEKNQFLITNAWVTQVRGLIEKNDIFLHIYADVARL